MPRVANWCVFGDESGTLQFNLKASRYFILTTVTLTDFSAGDALLALRRELGWKGVSTHPEFHATQETQAIRDQVFDVIEGLDFEIDSTVFEKRKALPRIRQTEAYFYQFAWFYHLRYLAYRFNQPDVNMLLVPATLAARGKKQQAFASAVKSVVSQVAGLAKVNCAFWMARTDPCLWLADYCSWAIQRKYEHTWKGGPDTRSYERIRTKIRSEFDMFRKSNVYYY